MAFQSATGFELQSLETDVEVSTKLGSPTISTSVKRSGAASMKISSLASGTKQGVRLTHGAAGTGPWFYQRCICVATRPSAANQILLWNDAANETSPLWWIELNSDGTLTFKDEDGTIGSPSSALNNDGTTWYYIEVKADLTGGAGAHVLEAKLNGTSFASASNRSISANPSSSSVGGNLASEAQTTGIWYFDDCIDNDNTGSMTGYRGGAKIIHLNPDAAGDNSNWTGSYTDIDEITPDDATTFINEGPAADTIDVNLSATPAELGSSDTIVCAFVGHRATLSSATGSDPRYVLRLKATSGGTTDESSAIIPNQTTWYTNQPGQRTYLTVANNSNYEQPGGSTAWTKSALDTAQIGARISTTDTDDVRITTMWLLVVFLPASGTAYNQSVSGGITPSGDIIKQGNKVLTGGNTPSGTVSKSTSKTFSGALSSIVGTLTKQTGKVLSGSISSIVGTLSTNRGYTRSFSGDVTPTGSLTKQGQKTLAGTLTSIGSVVKGGLKSIAGTLTSSGGIVKTAGKTLAGSISSSGATSKSSSKSFGGTLTSSGSLTKSVAKFFSGVLSFVGDLSADLTSGAQTYFQSLSGSIAPAGTLIKSTAKSFSGLLTSAGTLIKSAGKTLSGTITSSGTTNKLTTKSLSGAISSITGVVGKLTGKNLSGTVTSGGTVTTTSVFSKILSGGLSLAGTVSRNISKNFTGTVSPIGTVNKAINKFLSGVLDFVGSLLHISGIFDTNKSKIYLNGSRIITVRFDGSVITDIELGGEVDNIIYMRGSK